MTGEELNKVWILRKFLNELNRWRQWNSSSAR
jgi:hypothetical protein